ncbi:MAG: hypothetical protein O2856_05350 [Planctomycetota bacterium]|nr:hypothetical protein [Planctomycetota bacterium]
MTLNLSLLWSVTRCVIIAGIAVWPVAVLVARIEASPSVLLRRLRLLLAVFPFFVPELLIGFNYRLTVTQLTAGTSPLTAAIWTEALYGLLMLCRCMAVGVALSMLLPRSNKTNESLHLWLLLRRSLTSATWWRGWLRLKASVAWQAPLVAWSAMALVAFQEFETAALMQIDQHPISWSVWLFDAHAARLPLWDSLRMMAGPLLCELAILGPALCVLLLRPASEGNDLACNQALNGRSSIWKSARYSALLTPGIVLFVLWPLINNALPMMRGGLMMLENATLRLSLMQILTSTGFAVGATVLSMGIALQICRACSTTGRSIATQVLWMTPLLPGLLGSLVLSLSLLAMFQLPVVRGLYDTWLPMLLGQTLAVLPFAVVVVLLLQRISDPAALFSAELLAVSEQSRICRQMATIRWRLTTGRWLLGGLIVAHRCFWDVTVASILRPVQVEPVITRLYNEMHYGRTEALMSLSILAAVTPLAIAALAMMLSRLATISMSSR